MDERVDLLRKSWEGEIVGRAFFARLARLFPDDAGMWTAMAAVEEVTAALVAPVAAAHGIEIDEPSLAEGGEQFAEKAGGSGRGEILEGALAIIAEYLAMYERLTGLLDEDDVWLGRELVRHERALGAYMQAALDGRAGGDAALVEYLAAHGATLPAP